MIIRNLLLVLISGLIATCFPGCSRVEEKQETRPNILFIMLDDLGKEWIGVYGSNDVETPAVDELANTGIRFESVYSMPQCTPTRVTFLTGQYLWRHGWINHYDVPRWGHGGRFDPGLNPSFAKMLQGAGYRTCIAGKWQINDFRLEPEILNEAGFDEYCMWTGAEGGKMEKSRERYWNPYIHTKDGSRTYEGQFGEDVFSDFIIDFMKKNREEPMMIYYPMCLPHGPLTTTPAEPDVKGLDRHKAMVRYTDIILAKLLGALEELEIRDDTIVVWTTDNGSGGNLVGHINGKPVRGGKTLLSENGVNAPFIVNCPGLVPEGEINRSLIDFTDMLPTFCELAGIIPPGDIEFDGTSFAPVIRGEKEESDREWIMGMGSHAAKILDGRVTNAYLFRDRVIRDERYKAYINTGGEIYDIIDLQNDFYEQDNLVNSADTGANEAKSKFQKVLNSFPRKDNNPIYKKMEQSYYDIPEDELLKSCLKGMEKPNKTSPVNE